jgi:uncharacterized protein YvpB
MARTFFVFLMLFSLSITNVFATPRDVQYHWAGTEINTLLENGIAHGYDDGRFKPDRYITTEEARSLFASAARYQGSVSKKELNSGDLLHTGEENLTREALAVLIYNYYERSHSTAGYGDNKTCPFTDINGSAARDKIVALYKLGIINGYKDNTFQPNAYVTRGEAAALLCKVMGLAPIAPEITLPKYNEIPVPYISQVYPVSAPVGCEATSLLMGLHAKGCALGIGLNAFLDDMPKHASNPGKGFVGSPYRADKTKKTRTTILPGVLSAWASNYGNVHDFSGSSPEEIRAELLYGNPVVVYVTLWWEKPFYRTYNIEGQKKRMLSNNHAVLACGYDMENNIYYIADPYNLKDPREDLKYWINGDTFDRIYNERRHAVVVQ